MKELAGKVAVVTGAASGIGRALAGCFVGAGMRVALADLERPALEAAVGELRARGGTVMGVPTDVSRGAEVEALAAKTQEAFGAVHVVCNNAGVALSGPVWEHTVADWEWVLGVNLWGVIHGVRVFVPLLLRQGGEGHIVNTASIAGLTSNPSMGVYNVSKHAVVTLSETLHKDLALAGAPIRVSVLCPGFVNTRITDAHRNRPAALRNPTDTPRPPALEELIRGALATGLSPARVAEQVLDAIRAERFYVLTHPEFRARVRERMQDIVEDRVPAAALRLE